MDEADGVDEMDDEREFAEAIWGADFRPDNSTRAVVEGPELRAVVVDGVRRFRGLEFEATGMLVIHKSDDSVLSVQIYGGQNAHAHGPEVRASVERMARDICDGSDDHTL